MWDDDSFPRLCFSLIHGPVACQSLQECCVENGSRRCQKKSRIPGTDELVLPLEVSVCRDAWVALGTADLNRKSQSTTNGDAYGEGERERNKMEIGGLVLFSPACGHRFVYVLLLWNQHMTDM